MIGFAANRLMELEADGLCNAGRHERSPSAPTGATATATGSGRRAPALSISRSPSSARVLLPRVPGTPAHRRAGADRGDPGSLRARHLDAIGRRSRQSHGHDGHLEERGVAGVRSRVRRHRRARQGFPRPSVRRRLALPLAGRDLREGAQPRAHRFGCRDNRRGRQHAGAPRGDRRHRHAERGRDVLDRLPALADPAGPAQRQARRLGSLTRA